MENFWLTHCKRLHALATTGLQFTQSDYERDRYQDILDSVNAMLAELLDKNPATIRDIFSPVEDGYQTPKVDVRAALIRDEHILLVQEKTDRRWALPGGYADIGISPAQNAVKEVWEEAGIKVQVKRLYGVRHKAKGEYPPDLRDFYKLFFLCEEPEGRAQSVLAGSEVVDAQFFPLNNLPELSLGRVVESDLRAAFRYRISPNLPCYFDDASECMAWS